MITESRSKFQLIASFLLFLLLSACNTYETPQPVITRAASSESPNTPIVLETLTAPTKKITTGPAISQTLTPMQPSATTIPPTYTLGPTFSPAEEEAYWIKLISNNGGCELPCWWGITPGISPEKELLVLCRPWGLYDWYPWPTSETLEIQEYPFDVNQSRILNLSLTVYTQSGVVQRISILADNLQMFPDFSAAMQRYSLRNVFLRHGEPSRILLGIDRVFEANAPPMYSLWVFYDREGFLVVYNNEGWTQNYDYFQVCPSYDQVRNIRIYLQSPDNITPLENLVNGGLSTESLEYTIEKTTGLSVEEFYSEFIDEARHTCFESPENIWP